MIVWREWSVTKSSYGVVQSQKEYRLLLLFGIIPLFIAING